MSINECNLVTLPGQYDKRGNLNFIESQKDISFEIKRVYYLYGVPQGAERGAHAHKNLQQLIIAVSGSFDLLLDDGTQQKTIHLNSPNAGIYICPMIWRDLTSFSSDAVCMVLASDHYDESDYFRDYHNFLQTVRDKK